MTIILFQLTLVEGNHDVHLNSPETVVKYVGPFICGVKQDWEKTIENKTKVLTGLSKL